MRIAMLTYADLTGKRDAEAEFAKIVRAIGGTPRPPQAGQPNSPSRLLPHLRRSLTFNTAAVRELLMAAFSDEELTTFCYDNFRPVYEEFATGMSRTQKVQIARGVLRAPRGDGEVAGAGGASQSVPV